MSAEVSEWMRVAGKRIVNEVCGFPEFEGDMAQIIAEEHIRHCPSAAAIKTTDIQDTSLVAALAKDRDGWRDKAESALVSAAPPPTEPPLEPGEFYVFRGDGGRERCRYVGQSITIPWSTPPQEESDYRGGECEHCGRVRIELDGVCEKCRWNNDTHDWAGLSEPAPEKEK